MHIGYCCLKNKSNSETLIFFMCADDLKIASASSRPTEVKSSVNVEITVVNKKQTLIDLFVKKPNICFIPKLPGV